MRRRRSCAILFLCFCVCEFTRVLLSASSAFHDQANPDKRLEKVKEDVSHFFVCIAVCTKSLEHWSTISDSSLFTILLPSIERTNSPSDFAQLRVEVVVAYNHDDIFWDDASNRKEVVQKSLIAVNFVSIERTSKRVPFNEVTQVAYEYGADYIVRVNDDTEFVTPGWIRLGISALQQMEPPNIGVAGPVCNEGNVDILTHDMVHSTHLRIFHDYYPNQFNNWWVDDWISRVYGASRTRRVPGWIVKHHTHVHGQRYDVAWPQHDLLAQLVAEGEERIELYLANHTPVKRTSILNTGRMRLQEGRMKSYFG